MKPVDVQKEFNKAIIRRDRQTCVVCGSRENLSCSHFYGVGGNPSLRFHSENSNCNCFSCHRKHEDGGDEYLRWYEENKDGVLEDLFYMRFKICKLNESDLKQIKMLASRYEPNTSTSDNLEKINKIVEGGMK